MKTQNWFVYNQAQMNEKELLMGLLKDLCKSLEEPEYKFGRPKISNSDLVFCSVLKTYTMLSGRRLMSDIRKAKEERLIESAPHYNSLSNFMNNPHTADILQNLIVKSSLPLKDTEIKFAVDSTGFSTSVYDNWFKQSYIDPRSKLKSWIKCHVICGVQSNIITAVKLTGAKKHDSPLLKSLVLETSENFQMHEVSADKAYSSRDNHDLIWKVGAKPYIPFKKGTRTTKKGSKVWRSMYWEFRIKNEEFNKHYHLRSNVESTFSMIKRKFGSSVKSKNKTAQFNEVLCKILTHNICVVIKEMQTLWHFKRTGWAS